jgi:hypothetical protein|tara:strand:+ start:84 stop:746 length:663 start_codon:yes stop_codon:yes gene_type:complete
MLYPTYVIDNFFPNPDEVVKFSKTLDFGRDTTLGKWPGERTNLMHEINLNFFQYTTKKIMSLIFLNNLSNINWEAQQYFQKVPCEGDVKQGWVHNDSNQQLTAIVYLSKHKGCGTSIYRKNSFFNGGKNYQVKEEYYSKNKKFDKKYYQALEENNSCFTKTIEVESVFNRLVIFDGSQWHGVNGFYDKNASEDRLTLLTFFHDIRGNNLKFPISEMHRVL